MSVAPQKTIDATLTQAEARLLPQDQHTRSQPIETLTMPNVSVIFHLARGGIVKGWMATHILGTSRIDGRKGNRTYWHVVNDDAPHGERVRLIDPPPVAWSPCRELTR